MSLQDVDGLPAVAEAAQLEPGGHLVMAIMRTINSAGVREGEARRDRATGASSHGSYFAERRYADDIERNGLSMRFESEHRPIESYTRALEDAGFAIEALREVGEPDPGDKWSRMPLFLDLRAVRTPQ